MTAGRETERGVLGQQALVGSQPAECQLFMRMIQGELELTPAAAVTRLGGLGRQPEADLPEQLAPRQAESAAATDPHEGFDACALELRRRAPDQIATALERAVLLSFYDRGGFRFFYSRAHEPQSNNHSPRFPRNAHLPH